MWSADGSNFRGGGVFAGTIWNAHAFVTQEGGWGGSSREGEEKQNKGSVYGFA